MQVAANNERDAARVKRNFVRRKTGAPRRRVVLATWVVCASLCPPANATFSVLLANTRSGEIGGAVTSCVGDFDLENIFAVVGTPTGELVAVFTQSWFSESNHERVQELLALGVGLQDVLDQVTDPAIDSDQADRQYHFLQSDGSGVTWTGSNAGAFAGGVDGAFDGWAFTVAGNILTSEQVLRTMDASLRSSKGPLEHRLLAALEAVENDGQGDSRCSPLPGDSAFIGVVTPAGESRMWHSVTNTAPRSAVRELRARVGMPSAMPSATGTTNSPHETAAPPSDAAPAPETDDASAREASRSACTYVSKSTSSPSGTAWCLAACAWGVSLGRRKCQTSRRGNQ